MKFILKQIDTLSKYKCILFSTSFESSANDKTLILQILKENNISNGYIVLDLLLSKGDNFNRFVEMFIEDNKIKEMKILRNINMQLKNISLEFYLKNKFLLNTKSSICNFHKILKNLDNL